MACQRRTGPGFPRTSTHNPCTLLLSWDRRGRGAGSLGGLLAQLPWPHLGFVTSLTSMAMTGVTQPLSPLEDETPIRAQAKRCRRNTTGRMGLGLRTVTQAWG